MIPARDPSAIGWPRAPQKGKHGKLTIAADGLTLDSTGWGTAEAHAQRLVRHVVPLLWKNDGVWRVRGSAVAARSPNGLFLFSAAHVFAEMRCKGVAIFAPTGENGLIGRLEGEVWLSGTPELGDHRSDEVDVGVLKLDSLCPALASAALDLGDPDSLGNYDADTVLLLGYPYNRCQHRPRHNEVLCRPYPVMSQQAQPAAYRRWGMDERQHLILDWSSTWRERDRSHEARNLAGFSGGGIWTLARRGTERSPCLSAIFTDLKPKNGFKGLVGYRIHRHLWHAAQLCPQDRGFLEGCIARVLVGRES